MLCEFGRRPPLAPPPAGLAYICGVAVRRADFAIVKSGLIHVCVLCRVITEYHIALFFYWRYNNKVDDIKPRVDIKIHEGNVDGKYVVLFEVQAAANRPVRFKDSEYIRVGTYTKKLRDYPEKERNLWRIFDRVNFEDGIAKKDVSSDDVLSLIDYPNYFGILKEPLPDNRAAILQRLISDKIIVSAVGEQYDITNIGAILFAKNLNDFERLSRKALRVMRLFGHSFM